MNIRKLKLFSFAAIIATVAFVACKDEFSEQDFLKLQSDLAIKADSAKLLAQFKANGAESEAQAASYVAALNQAGDLLGVSILVREDNKPIEGVSVSINTVAAPVVTNASGIAYFDRVRIAEATVILSKANYASASALVTFGTPSTPPAQTVSANGVTTTRYVAPAKRFENVGLPLFAVGGTGGSTAIIRGRVTYERDLTNQLPEIPRFLPAGGGAPTPITIQANLRAALAPIIVTSSSTGGNADVLTYQIADGAFGSSTVDLITGNYSMVVPASVGGINGYSFIIPEITENQTLAINQAPDATGLPIPLPNGPELRTDVPTRWSSSYAADNSPSVASAFLYFPEPPQAGRGFAPTFTPISRPIEIGVFGDVAGLNQELVGNTIIRITNRGKDYATAPSVTFPGGQAATTTSAAASLRGFIKNVNVTNGGNGFTPLSTVYVQFNQTLPTPGGGSTSNSLNDISRLAIPVLVTGSLSTAVITLPNTSGYFGHSTPFTTDVNVSGFTTTLWDAPTGGNSINNTSATISVERVTELNAIHITNAGTYSSAPSQIDISGGNPSTPATAIVQEYRVQWLMNFPNTAPITPYKVLPSGFELRFPAYGTSNFTTNSNVELIGANGNVAVAAAALGNQLATDGTTITKRPQYSNLNYRTNAFWHVAPELVITDRTRSKAVGTASIDNISGRVTSLSVTDIGAGYDEATLKNVAIRPAFTGAPGSGATVNVNISSIDAITGVATMAGVNTLILGNNGSGYKTNVNANQAGPSQDAIPAVRTGQTYNVDVRLGTGDRPAGYN